MRYIFISDIHGCFDKMMEALNSVSFNKETDTLVSLGDPFDRGYCSREVLEYLLSCPHRIFVWGNHDRRLYELVLGKDYITNADYANGVPATICSLCETSPLYGVNALLFQLQFNDEFKPMKDKLFNYFDECCWAIEFKDLIATHAWLPNYQDYDSKKYHILNDWRKMYVQDIWYDATWSHSENLALDNTYPDKTLLIGHWHAWRLARAFGEKRFEASSIAQLAKKEHINCETFISPDNKLIAIDGCSNYPYGGQVNAFVYESKEEPKIY